MRIEQDLASLIPEETEPCQLSDRRANRASDGTRHRAGAGSPRQGRFGGRGGKGPEPALKVIPKQVSLRGPDSVQQFIVDGISADVFRPDHEAQFVSADPEVAEVDEAGMIWARETARPSRSVAEGSRRRSPSRCATCHGHSDQLREPDHPDLHQARLQRGRLPRQGEWTERIPPQPARVRAGARLRDAGQGRPRPPALSRRTRSEPAPEEDRQVPTAAASVWTGSNEYRAHRWIASGMPVGKQSDPTVARIAVYPEARVLARGAVQQVVVTAHTPMDRRRTSRDGLSISRTIRKWRASRWAAR